MDEETYQAFMSEETTETEEQTNSDPETDPTTETNGDPIVTAVVLADFEFIQDKETSNWMMNDATYKKLIGKVFD